MNWKGGRRGEKNEEEKGWKGRRHAGKAKGVKKVNVGIKGAS